MLFASNAEQLLKQHSKDCYKMLVKEDIKYDIKCEENTSALFITLSSPQDCLNDEPSVNISLFGETWRICGYIKKDPQKPHTIAVIRKGETFYMIDGTEVNSVTPNLENIVEITLENVHNKTHADILDKKLTYQEKFHHWRTKLPQHKEKDRKRKASDEYKEETKKRMASAENKERNKE